MVTHRDVRILGERLAASLPEEEKALFEAYLQILERSVYHDGI